MYCIRSRPPPLSKAAKSALAAAVPLAHPAPNAVLYPWQQTPPILYQRRRRPTSSCTGEAGQPLAFFFKKLSGAGRPLLHLRPSAPSATFVSRARIFKTFEGAQESIPSLAGRIDSSESISGLLKRLQIWALLEGRRFRHGFRRLTDQSPNLSTFQQGAQESIPSLAGRYDVPSARLHRLVESIIALLKHLLYKYGLRRLRV